MTMMTMMKILLLALLHIALAVRLSCMITVSALVPARTPFHSRIRPNRRSSVIKVLSRRYDKSSSSSTITSESSRQNNSITSSTSSSTSTSGSNKIDWSQINRNDQRDLLIARAAKLRQSIVKQQAELMELEQKIECSTNGYHFNNYRGAIEPSSLSSSSSSSTMDFVGAKVSATITKFISSANVLKRKLERVNQKIGPNNKKWSSVNEYFLHEMASGLRIVGGLVQKPEKIQHLIDPSTPTLIPHVPAIIARLDKLEDHVDPILERVLNNRQHLYSVEPYLDEILERFDDIEPHLPWILDNIDVLAPNTGLLLKHIDALLLFAESNEKMTEDDSDSDTDTDNEYGIKSDTIKSKGDDDEDAYSLANQLLPYLEYYVSNLDIIGPHLVLLRPHVPLLLKHNRIAKISPHIDKLFARGYKDLGASANLDILLFWFGWSLQVPFLPALFFSLPFSPRLVTFLANRLPKKFARKGKGYCRRLRCVIDDDYGDGWNKLESRSS